MGGSLLGGISLGGKGGGGDEQIFGWLGGEFHPPPQ